MDVIIYMPQNIFGQQTATIAVWVAVAPTELLMRFIWRFSTTVITLTGRQAATLRRDHCALRLPLSKLYAAPLRYLDEDCTGVGPEGPRPRGSAEVEVFH